MPEASAAEKHLIGQIRSGDADGWGELVARYHGRLLAFARGRVKRHADAEDLVQDTFIAFLQHLDRFDAEQSLETYLFTILRRRTIDLFRSSARRPMSLNEGPTDDGQGRAAAVHAAADLSASRYARVREQAEADRRVLARALHEVLERLRQEQNFRDLKILEAVLYRQMRNKDVAGLVGHDEKQVALIKHRTIARVRAAVEQQQASGTGGTAETRNAGDAGDAREAGRARDAGRAREAGCVGALDDESAGSLLTEVWEEQRLTCPKRTTLGKHLLGTLEEPWAGYVAYHLQTIRCGFCLANVEDLGRHAAGEEPVARRVMQSTVGFFKRT